MPEDNTVRKSNDDEATEFLDGDCPDEDGDWEDDGEDEYWDRTYGSQAEDYEDFNGLGDEDGD